MTDPATTETETKPLRLPLPPRTKEAGRALRRLRGHSTAADWLPEGLSPELDQLRAEQLRLRAQVAAELDALDEASLRFRREDKEHERSLRQDQRDGRSEAVEDGRTLPDVRRSELVAIEERYWAAVVVLADLADAVIALVRQQEDDLLGQLRSQLAPAEEKRREAQRLLEEAKAEEWTLHRLGQWVQVTSDDGPHGRQPAPTLEPPPAQFSAEVFRSMLERPWHRDRPWAEGEGEEEVRSWLEESEDQHEVVDLLSPEDVTGLVSELDESASQGAKA